MARPLRYQETSQEIIVNMDEELFKIKKDFKIPLIIGVFTFWTIIGCLIAGMSTWFLYNVNNRIEKMEIWIKEKYEKEALKKGKRLVITYNPEGQQFYPRQ